MLHVGTLKKPLNVERWHVAQKTLNVGTLHVKNDVLGGAAIRLSRKKAKVNGQMPQSRLRF